MSTEFRLQSQCFVYHWNNYQTERGLLFAVGFNGKWYYSYVVTTQSAGVYEILIPEATNGTDTFDAGSINILYE